MTTPSQLQRVEALPVATQEPQDLLRLAVERGADVGTIERLMAVRRELNAEQAKRQFDVALADFQAECPVVIKTTNVDGKYNYSKFEDIIAVARPFLQKHGFSFTLGTDVTSADGWVIATCRAVHNAGHSEISTAKFPLGKGTALMSTTQVYASALSFASRRVFCNCFGIVTAGEDKDGRQPQAARGPSSMAAPTNVKDLARELWELLKPVRGEEKNWRQANQWLIDECIIAPEDSAPNFEDKQFRAVIEAARKKVPK